MSLYRVDLKCTLTTQVTIDASDRHDAEEQARLMMCDMEVDDFDDGWGEEEKTTGSIVRVDIKDATPA